MALPSGITPKTVTVGIASFFDGSLAEGTATITAPVNVVHTPTNRPIFSSQMSHRFVDGETSFNLCPTDAPGLNRVDFSYKLSVVISGALVQPEPIYFTLPTAGPDTIDLDALVTVPSSAGTPISVDVLTTEDLPGHMADVAADSDSEFAVAQRAASGSVVKSRVGGLRPPTLRNIATEVIGATRPFGLFDGYLWGINGTALRRSADDGVTWQNRGTFPAGTYIIKLFGATGGEVLALAAEGVYRSAGWAGGNPTWTKVVTPNGVCQLQPWALDGNGTKFICSEYAAGASFPDSRYVRISLDGGQTWTVAYDSVAKHGATAANQSHLHGVAYDPWADRFYLTEGHSTGGDIGGIYFSDDDGATWTRAAGMASNPAPTVLVATDDGLVCGSDNEQGGLYGVLRNSDGSREQLVRNWRWRPGKDGTLGFGLYGYREPTTGVVYIGFRCEFADVAPIIAAGTPTSGALVYTWPTLPIVAYDDIRMVVLPRPDALLAVASVNGALTMIRAQVAAPGAADPNVNDAGGVLGGAALSGTSLAVAPRASAAGIRSLAVGVGSSTTGVQDGTAVGYAATVGTSGTAVGQSAAAAGSASTAVGDGSTTGVAGNSESTAIGAGALTSAGSATAVGRNAKAASASASLGRGADANNEGVALGYGATVGATHNRGVALGTLAVTTAAAQVQIGPRHVELTELASDPAAPATNGARWYVRDNGSGKTQLCVRFATGAVVVIATEP